MDRTRETNVKTETTQILDALRDIHLRLRVEAVTQAMQTPGSLLLAADEIIAATIRAIEVDDERTLSDLRKIARAKRGIAPPNRPNEVDLLLQALSDLAGRDDVRELLDEGEDARAGALVGNGFVDGLLALGPELEKVRPMLGTAEAIEAARDRVVATATVELLTYDTRDDSGSAVRVLLRKLLAALGMSSRAIDRLLAFDHKRRSKVAAEK
jgi:hypothetical protein